MLVTWNLSRKKKRQQFVRRLQSSVCGGFLLFFSCTECTYVLIISKLLESSVFSFVCLHPKCLQTLQCQQLPQELWIQDTTLVRKGLLFKRETYGCRYKVNKLLPSSLFVSVISQLFCFLNTLVDAKGTTYISACWAVWVGSLVDGST